MNKHTMALIWSIGLLFGFACIAIRPNLEDTSLPTVQIEPTAAITPLTPESEPSSTSVNVPIPDFAESIIFQSYGGGWASCSFELPAAPSVTGGTLYRVTQPLPDSSPDDPDGGSYPRGAQLCIAGAPEDQPIAVKLTSPDLNVFLTAEIKTVVDPWDDQFLSVLWTGYPENWSLEGADHVLSGGGQRGYEGFPSQVILDLWWPGSLAKGIWQVEVSWPGQTVYGQFVANTRNLPEISLSDPRAVTQLFPNIDAVGPYTCHLASDSESHQIVAENFQANSLIYILIYSSPPYTANSPETKLQFKTAIYTDENGFAVAELPADLVAGNRYHILGVPEEVSTVTWNDGFEENAFAFTAIANAMDCFVLPS